MVSTDLVALAGASLGEFVDVSSPEVPEPWASAMVAARLTDPRSGAPSMRALAAAMDTHTSTVSAMIHARRKTSSSIIARAAVALRMEDRVAEVFAWAGVSRSEADSFDPHPDADLLSAEERKAVNDLISLLVRGRREQAAPVHIGRRLRQARRDLAPDGDASDSEVARQIGERVAEEQAARPGRSTTRAARKKQDAEATAPDEPGEDTGA